MHRFVIEGLEDRRLLAYVITAGDTGFDYGTCSALLPDGSVIVAGIFSGTVSFDPVGGSNANLTSSGRSDVFAAKYAADGDLVWVRQFGGPSGPYRIARDLGDAVDVAIRPSRAGGEIWDNGVGTDPRGAGEYVNSLAVAPDGSIYLTGGFLGRADFDPGPGEVILASGNTSYLDVYVVKLTSGGNLLWAEKFGGRFTDNGNDIAVDSNGNPYITGLFTRTADFNPSAAVFNINARGRADAFVMMLSGATGRLVWVAQLGGDSVARNEIDGGNGIAVDAANNVYITGSFSRGLFFQQPPNRPGQFVDRSVGRTDAFTAKLDPTGNLVWFRPTGGDRFDGNVAIALLGSPTAPEVITGGYFSDKITIGPGPGAGTLRAVPEQQGETPFATDLLVSRWDNDGNLIWGKQMGGGFFEIIGRIAVDASSNIYITGGFEQTVDFDPSGAEFLLTSIRLPRQVNDNNEQDGRRRSSYDNFFSSLDVNGAFRFATSFGGNDDDIAVGISRPQIGQPVSSFILTGRFGSTANFDPSGSVERTALGRSDIWLGMYDRNGNIL